MSNLVSPDEIESIVGATRHPTRHLGRAVSSEETVYILHSGLCKASGVDLRKCAYSRALDYGIDPVEWKKWEDQPVVLGLGQPLAGQPFGAKVRIFPLRVAVGS